MREKHEPLDLSILDEINAIPPTYYLIAEMLGSVADEDDTERMAELLRARGYRVEVAPNAVIVRDVIRIGQQHPKDIVPQEVWDECLALIWREKEGSAPDNDAL